MNIKQNPALKFILLILLFGVLNSCEDQSYIRHTYTANIAKKYMSYDELRSAVKLESGSPLHQPGKIYFKSSLMYINELYKGIHVIDNSDPSNPQDIGFINIPGNVDIAIKGNILYADSYIDLVAIDISDIRNGNVKEVNRVENLFPYKFYGVDPEYPVASVDTEKGVVVEWAVEEITEDIEGFYFDAYNNKYDDIMFLGSAEDANVRYNSTGKAGSMASFMIFSNYLYVINNTQIDVFDISDYTNLQKMGNSVFTGRNIETLFVYNNMLFVGTTSGMLIYSLSVPESPSILSAFDHATACDPVVVQGSYAFVTLRAGNACGGWQNQMDVIDISNVNSPQLIRSYELMGPYGLGVDNDKVFVCDGDDGLKVYTDANYPDNLTLKKHFPEINAYDVIPMGNILFVIGKDGFYQYDYTNLDQMSLLSSLPIN